MNSAFCPVCHTVNPATASLCRSCSAKMEPAPQTSMQVSRAEAQLELSGAFRRLIAVTIDSIAMTIGVVILALIYVLMGTSAETWDDPEKLEGIGNAFGFIGAWLYFAVLESSESHTTIGERMMGIMVTNSDGEPLTFMRASLRHVGRIICWLTFGFGYLTMLFTKRRQGLHDLISGCVVVRC